MPVARTTGGASLWCVLLLVGCPNATPLCPEATVIVDPAEIPSGVSETNVSVVVSNPSPENGLGVVTELTSISGTIVNPFAQKTTFRCAHDVSGEAEICAHATYLGGDGGPDGGVPEGGMPEALECSETRCTKVICPDEKNVCPVVSSFTVEPMEVPEGGTATITVVAEDPDDNPEALATTLSARHGTIAGTTYTCDPDIGGCIPICVRASDGDSGCDFEQCAAVLCPGEPLENTCPIIETFTADPDPILAGDDTTTVRVEVTDCDEIPQPLRTEFRSDTGVFGDRFVSETTFRCGDSGSVELCLEASDGAPECDQDRCITVQCPSDIRPNICPMLFVISVDPRIIAPGKTTTEVQTRAQETDGKPFPTTLALRALWGSFENAEYMRCEEVTLECPGPIYQNATYICDRPGDIEICVDATDGACVKTSCTDVTCPDDIP